VKPPSTAISSAIPRTQTEKKNTDPKAKTEHKLEDVLLLCRRSRATGASSPEIRCGQMHKVRL